MCNYHFFENQYTGALHMTNVSCFFKVIFASNSLLGVLILVVDTLMFYLLIKSSPLYSLERNNLVLSFHLFSQDAYLNNIHWVTLHVKLGKELIIHHVT